MVTFYNLIMYAGVTGGVIGLLGGILTSIGG